jgi:hypothetical protein
MPGPVIATEKVDGTNSRVIVLEGDYILASREELLFHSGDLLHNPSQSIVEYLRPLAEAGSFLSVPGCLTVWYGELYGGKIGKGAKQYTGHRTVGFRLFDIALIRLDDVSEMLKWKRTSISSWREHGGQEFFGEQKLTEFANTTALELTPRLARFDFLHTSHQKVLEILERFLPRTQVALDEQARGQAEGIVFRTSDRSALVKAKFKDYRRALEQ